MYKIMSIVGNRPHFIKLSPVYDELKEKDNIEQIIVHTGQHYDEMLSGHFIKELDIPEPQYNLGVGSQRPIIQMAKIMEGLDPIIEEQKPDLILVYGDTNSTAAAAISAAKNHISLGHVESGLREFSKLIPEEINKLLTDSVTDQFFCPTETGEKNLINDGKGSGVYLVGDVGLDLIQNNKDRIEAAESVLSDLDLVAKKYVFMTCHRASNTDDLENIKNILDAANEIGRAGKKIVFPMHPRTKAVIQKHNLRDQLNGDHWTVIRPIGFFETQALIKNASFTFTDSGGVIKESYFHKTPCIIIDKQTEWIEAVTEGWCFVCGPDKEKIMSIATKIPRAKNHFKSLGDGTASKKIAKIIVSYLSKKKQNEF